MFNLIFNLILNFTRKQMQMKSLTIVFIAGLMALGGCASMNDGVKSASAQDEESYIPLGSSIPKKGKRSSQDQTVDLQQLENARTMNNATINSAK
jgi:hypothetical protein